MHKIEQLSDQQLMKEIMSDNFKAFTVNEKNKV